MVNIDSGNDGTKPISDQLWHIVNKIEQDSPNKSFFRIAADRNC